MFILSQITAWSCCFFCAKSIGDHHKQNVNEGPLIHSSLTFATKVVLCPRNLTCFDSIFITADQSYPRHNVMINSAGSWNRIAREVYASLSLTIYDLFTSINHYPYNTCHPTLYLYRLANTAVDVAPNIVKSIIYFANKTKKYLRFVQCVTIYLV